MINTAALVSAYCLPSFRYTLNYSNTDEKYVDCTKNPDYTHVFLVVCFAFTNLGGP